MSVVALANVAPHPPEAPSEMPSPRVCLNCAAILSGAYCAECGQLHSIARLSLRSMGAEFGSQFIALDHGVLHTFLALLRHPGVTIREYTAGRRRSYTSPVTFALLGAAASLLLANITPANRAHYDALFTQTPPNMPGFFTPAQTAAYDRIRVLLATNQFASMPAIALPIIVMLRLFFRRQQVNLAEMGALACYTLGQLNIFAFLVSLPFVLSGGVTTGSAVLMVCSAPYLVWVGFGYFGRSFATAWRVLAAVFCGLLVFAAATLVIPLIVAR